ncbi:acetyl-CoA synthetase-like protein [Penicillium angulare]|uniref:Acetyl-CoA synthetase-like protein n=1 Tax=Penicillium angulare TaxID=116970 RepID=A0A9W9FI68_9EURO|nr:acetyl-CoA synthetase-like protein [Penicillium angulare]
MKLPFDGDLDPRTVLFPNLIDYYAKIKPDAIYAECPINPTSYDEGYRKITYKAFANAINGLAQFLVDALGHGNGEVLAYVGPNDMRYPGLVLGALKAGYCMFMTSPRNSVEAHRSLLQTLDCNTLLTPVPRPPFIGAILDAHPVKTLDIPDLETLLTSEYSHFEYSKSLSEALHEKFAIVHTSGSTGIPKPIIWKHDSGVKNMNMQFLQPPEGCVSQESLSFGKRLYLTLPPFHAAGLAFMLLINVPANVTTIIPTSGGLPSLASLLSAREKTPFDCALVPPNIIGEMAQDAKALDYCATHLEHITYVGGDVPQLMGNVVAAKMPLTNGYGASETGLLNVIHSPNRDPKTDWRYLNFNPDLGVEMQHVSGDEYEAVMVRTPSRVSHQCPFVLFPDLQEYHTNDLMIRHPTKPDLWRPSARLDDVIVFLNGEKTNPVSMEHHIVSVNPGVTGCLVVGAQRFQAALVVEIGGKPLSVNDRAAMIDQLWPSIEEANSVCPAHARIVKSHILFTSPEKPMPRSGKGTVQRAMTLKIYEQEIENLYQDADKLSEIDASQLPGPGGVEDATKVAEYIKASLLAVTGWSAETLTDEENWFNLGLDSLQTITATRLLRHGLNIPTLSPNVIYLNPTLTTLTHALHNFHKKSEESAKAAKQRVLQERDELFQELSGRVEIPNVQNTSNTPPAAHTAILTGSTGQLGTHILNSLLERSEVEHIYCLNRDENARDRQLKRGAAYGLAPVDEARVTFWKADLSQVNLGLQPDQLQKLQQTATLVIHNAWTVNFNLSVASFKPQLEGVVNLINFSAQATLSPRILFVSSISSVLGNRTDTGLTPESLITTENPAPNGYATSKYIAEHLLGYAAQRGLSGSAFARVGQVAGPIRSPGLWNKSEWLPSVTLSSVHLGAVPSDLGVSLSRVDWVPIDLLSDILVDLSLLNNSELSVYHLVNLHPKPWGELQPVIVDSLQKITGKSLETIPLRNWVIRVRKDIESVGQGDKGLDEKKLQLHLATNPAAKLLEFFEALVAQTQPDDLLDTQKTAQASTKLREVDGVKPEWVQKWVKEWLE